MARLTRRIGLSLGADLCWPVCYEDVLRDLDLELALGGDRVRFEVERVTIEPFKLSQRTSYDLVIDRLTHWYGPSREWIKKSILLDGLYVYNNPWSVQSMHKHTTYCAMMRLGLPIPATWLVPPKAYEPAPDLQPTLERYARLFDLGPIGADLGYPLFMKPYDGGGWIGVTKVEDEAELRAAYETSGKLVMHLQAGVHPYDDFVRCVGLGPQVRYVRYDPAAPLHDRYKKDRDFLPAPDEAWLRAITLTINAFFGWDFNSCELLAKDGDWIPIDYANPCPDSQVTSLHVHFPWIVLANLRWSLFVAATGRAMRPTLDWQRFFAVADTDLPLEEKVRRYGAIAEEHFETERFEAFCAEHLPHLDEALHAYFGEDRAKQAIHRKVQALFPEHEVEEYTELFWSRVQEWRTAEAPTAVPPRARFAEPVRPDASSARSEEPATPKNPAVKREPKPAEKRAAKKAGKKPSSKRSR